MTNYHLPEIPLTPVDLVNRRASASSGSFGYAMATSHADYNGHSVSVTFKPHAMSGPVWNAEYFWGGRRVIGRGSLRDCLQAAKREYDRGMRGTIVNVALSDAAPESLIEQQQLCETLGYAPGKAETRPWWTGTHEAVRDALARSQPDLITHALQYTGSAKNWPSERARYLTTH